MSRRPALVALVALACQAGCGGGTAPVVPFSIALGDGRTCRDASVTTVVVERGEAPAQRFPCVDVEAPRAQTAASLPLTDEVAVLGLSADGGRLYRGRLIASEAIARQEPITIVLYPDWAR